MVGKTTFQQHAKPALSASLMHTIELRVRFSEADPLGIVWHGNYIKYFEDGREAFGSAYQLHYLDFKANGLAVPIINLQCEFKRMVKYGETIILQTSFEPCEAAKLKFSYALFTPHTKLLIATGTTTQVFIDSNSRELILHTPDFMQAWKDKWLK